MAHRTIASAATSTKVAIVVGGYVVALAIACVVVYLYVAATSTPDRQTYGGMFAFGDSLLFLAAFGVVSVPASAVALFLLRPYPLFWFAFSIGALLFALTGLAAVVAYAFAPMAEPGSALHAWSSLAPLRMLASPIFAIAFFVSSLLAPNRAARVTLLAVAAFETTVFAYIAFVWFLPLRFR